MNRSYLNAAITAVFIVAFVLVGRAQTGFVGEWQNVDPRTGGMTSIAIAPSSPNLDVQVWGKCQPSDCNWGKTRLFLVGNSIEDRSFRNAFAIWQTGFGVKYVSFSLSPDGNLLGVQTTTIFNDGSGRSNFRVTERFQRSRKDTHSKP